VIFALRAMRRDAALGCLTVLLAASMVAAQEPAAAPDKAAMDKSAPKPGSYESMYEHYLQTARATQNAPGPSIGWMTQLAADPRAHQVNDLLTVRVIESITAAGKADSTVNKNSSGAAGVTHAAGAEMKLPSWIDAANVLGFGADSKYAGGGATTRTGELTAVMTVRVSEVLPNGDLVLEGAREIDINGDRQMVVLTGVVRAPDISRNNTVLSTQIGQLSIRYFGNGLMKDSLKPGFLTRILNKIF
jgi:flagellar L-ring protein FlgH